MRLRPCSSSPRMLTPPWALGIASGGAQDLPREVDWPSCPQGDGAMSFYAQLDGVPAVTEFDLADEGLIFVFVCFDCFKVQALIHTA
jgi:hypothetical protein